LYVSEYTCILQLCKTVVEQDGPDDSLVFWGEENCFICVIELRYIHKLKSLYAVTTVNMMGKYSAISCSSAGFDCNCTGIDKSVTQPKLVFKLADRRQVSYRSICTYLLRGSESFLRS
jgi:hypothetical protein